MLFGVFAHGAHELAQNFLAVGIDGGVESYKLTLVR